MAKVWYIDSRKGNGRGKLKKVALKTCSFVLLMITLVSLCLMGGCKYTDFYGSKMIKNKVVKENRISFVECSYHTEWLKNNRTYAHHEVVDGDVVEDWVSPQTRTYYITNEEERNEVFSALENVDFNTEMVVIFLYTNIYNRDYIVKSVYIGEEGFLNIEFDDVEGKPGYNDASMPHTRRLTLRMKNIWKDKVKITYLGP